MLAHNQQVASGPASKPVLPEKGQREPYRVHPDDEANVRVGLADVIEGRTVELTEDELAEWERTGELPSSAQERFAALECGAPRS